MSRNREYLADASGVQLTRYPPGLISALEKLRDDQAVVHHATKATAQMWIEQPLETDKKKAARRSSTTCSTPTHPSRTGSRGCRRCSDTSRTKVLHRLVVGRARRSPAPCSASSRAGGGESKAATTARDDHHDDHHGAPTTTTTPPIPIAPLTGPARPRRARASPGPRCR